MFNRERQRGCRDEISKDSFFRGSKKEIPWDQITYINHHYMGSQLPGVFHNTIYDSIQFSIKIIVLIFSGLPWRALACNTGNATRHQCAGAIEKHLCLEDLTPHKRISSLHGGTLISPESGGEYWVTFTKLRKILSNIWPRWTREKLLCTASRPFSRRRQREKKFSYRV